MTEVHFYKIKQKIIKELQNAQNSIKIASAYFTDKELFDQLITLLNQGIEVQLIISDEPVNLYNKEINYIELVHANGDLFIANRTEPDTILHHKFCIIDDRKVITGSYDWTKKATQNLENIVILDEDDAVYEFVEEFEEIKKHYASVVEDWYDKPVYSGFNDLDQATGGFLPNELVCILGKEFMGTTDFILSMFTEMQKFDTKVAYINSHTPPHEVLLEWCLKLCGLSSEKIKRNQFSAEDKQAITEKMAEITSANKFFFSEDIETLQDLLNRCKILRIKHTVQIIVIDKIDHLLSKDHFKHDLSYTVFKELKNLARYLRIPILVVTERGVSYTDNGIPRLNNIPFVLDFADNFLLVHRDECLRILEDEEGNSLKGVTKVIIEKHTTRPKTVLLNYNEELRTFHSVDS